MTNILATKFEDEYRLECRDHADSVEVCAGISALCYALAGAVLNHDSVVELSYDLQPGYAKIEFYSSDERADEDFRCCLIGLMQIAESHPDEINLTQNVIE